MANDAIYPFVKVKAFSDNFGRIYGAEYKWKLHPSSEYCNSWVKLIEYLDSIIKPLLNYLKNSDSHVYVKIGGKMIKLDSTEYIFEEVWSKASGSENILLSDFLICSLQNVYNAQVQSHTRAYNPRCTPDLFKFVETRWVSVVEFKKMSLPLR